MNFQVTGLNYLVDGVGQASTLTIRAYDGGTLEDSQVITFDSAASGEADMASVAGPLVIDAGVNIDSIQLYASGDYLAGETAAISFTNGGNIVINSCTITVTGS